MSCPVRSARTISRPLTATVPAVTVLPGAASAGTGSPVITLVSTADSPNSTTPSAAITSPGRTTTRSPGRSRPADTRRSVPSAHSTLAPRAPVAASSRIASPASRRARASYSRPASKKVVTDAATSR